jgi:hypothetical protein
MECFERSSDQVLWSLVKEVAARSELQLDTLDLMGSGQATFCDHPSSIANKVAQVVLPIAS